MKVLFLVDCIGTFVCLSVCSPPARAAVGTDGVCAERHYLTQRSIDMVLLGAAV